MLLPGCAEHNRSSRAYELTETITVLPFANETIVGPVGCE
jgi:hypothetical protein